MSSDISAANTWKTLSESLPNKQTNWLNSEFGEGSCEYFIGFFNKFAIACKLKEIETKDHLSVLSLIYKIYNTLDIESYATSHFLNCYR